MECKHENLEIIVLENGPHWGKEICSDCGAYRRFVSKPGHRNYADCSADLIKLCEDLLDNKLVESITIQYEEKGFISKKQYAWLMKIAGDNNLGGKAKELGLCRHLDTNL